MPVKNFNSIKVRLKLLKPVRRPVVRQFQFHKGTIKTAPVILSKEL